MSFQPLTSRWNRKIARSIAGTCAAVYPFGFSVWWTKASSTAPYAGVTPAECSGPGHTGDDRRLPGPSGQDRLGERQRGCVCRSGSAESARAAGERPAAGQRSGARRRARRRSTAGSPVCMPGAAESGPCPCPPAETHGPQPPRASGTRSAAPGAACPRHWSPATATPAGSATGVCCAGTRGRWSRCALGRDRRRAWSRAVERRRRALRAGRQGASRHLVDAHPPLKHGSPAGGASAALRCSSRVALSDQGRRELERRVGLQAVG